MTFIGKRNLSAGIYFLIEKENFSAFHRIKSDKMWHYYSGDPLLINVIDLNGSYTSQAIGFDFKDIRIANSLIAKEFPQHRNIIEQLVRLGLRN